MDKILLEYKQYHCNKIEKKATITWMAIADSNETAISCGNISFAFDCDQKKLWSVYRDGQNQIAPLGGVHALETIQGSEA